MNVLIIVSQFDKPDITVGYLSFRRRETSYKEGLRDKADVTEGHR